MHLRQRRRGEWRLVEGGEHFADGPPGAPFDAFHGHRGLERRHLILQQRQLVGEVDGQEVAAGG